jgi:hypothetical protein
MAMCEFTVLGEWMTAGEITRAAASIVASRRRDKFISPKRESAEGEPGFSDCALKVENVTQTGRCIRYSFHYALHERRRDAQLRISFYIQILRFEFTSRKTR